jgi:putative ABC transport system permease protein
VFQFVERLRGVPGVIDAGAVRRLPYTGFAWTSDFTIEGWEVDQFGVEIRHREASPGYFGTMGIPVLSGRVFDVGIAPDEAVPVVVNQAFADRYFPDDTPVGRRITFSRTPRERSYWYPIVGVVGNERMSITSDPLPEVIAHLRGDMPNTPRIAVKTAVDPLTLVPTVRTTLAELDADIPLVRIRTMDEVAADARASDHFLMTLLGIFAVAAVALAAVGVYGVAAQAARSRTREIGIRMALGAPMRDIVRALLYHNVSFLLVGLALGVAGAFAGGRVIGSLLYGVTPNDPVTLVSVVGLMAVTALLASYWPAWRAGRLDPARVLRSE